jgi:hypothetical protein
MKLPQAVLHTWEKLCVAAGNNELSNKMASYTTDQKMVVIKTFHSSGGSCVAVERQCRREFFVRVAPACCIKQFEETGNVRDKGAKRRKQFGSSFA